MAIYLIDGDNKPGERFRGMEWLQDTDSVKVFFAATNKYYNREKQDYLKAQTKAEVRFYEVPSGKNAVDFAAAAEVGAQLAMHSPDRLYLVSGDNDFLVISKLLQKQYPKTKTSRIDTILNGFLDEPETISDLKLAEQILQRSFGEEAGKQFFDKLSVLLRVDEIIENEKKRGNIWENIMRLLQIKKRK